MHGKRPERVYTLLGGCGFLSKEWKSFMKRRSAQRAAVLLVGLMLPLTTMAVASPAEKQVFDQLNQERQKAGLPALEWNELAAEAARRHAALLAENATLSHQFTGEPSLAERLGAAGVRFTRAGENIARTEHIEDIHPALMNSPGHRANILNPHYNAVGIAVVERSGRV